MKKLKSFIDKITIVFCMTLMFGILGSSNVFAAGTTWDTDWYNKLNSTLDSNHTMDINLSNNNLTVSPLNHGGTVRATNPIDNNKKVYWEVKIETYGTIMIGIVDGNFTSDDPRYLSYLYKGKERSYTSWYSNKCMDNQAVTKYSDGADFLVGDTIGVAVDRVTNTITFYKNGVSQGIAFNDLNLFNTIYPAVSFDRNGKVTTNFGATPFAYPIPDGYVAYDSSTSNVSVSSISLNKTTDSLQVGQTDTLTTIITPDNATNKNVTWKSSDESIATVDSTGKVTANKEGTATVTATTTDGSNLSASCTVNVTNQATITLSATASTTSQAIMLNWNTFDGATGYNVKRSTTQGSGYATIASNVTGTAYNDNDSALQAGTTYYYMVTPIINGSEGTPSNEALAIVKSITPTNPTDNSGNALLTITMTNGNVKSYTVPMTKVNDFISWYDNRISGSTGKAYYTFDKTDSSQTSFSKKTEYIIFDKISSYEVDEYSK